MKKITAVVFIVITALVGLFASGPFIAVNAIRNAVDQQDKVALEHYVDFPTLRANLKEQLKTQMSSKLNSEAQRNPFAALAAGFAGKMLDGVAENMVDQIVTPAGLGELLVGKREYTRHKQSLSQDAGNAAAGGSDVTPVESATAPTTGHKENPNDHANGENHANSKHHESEERNARWGFDSASSFSLYVTSKRGEQLRFILTRHGFSWRLSNIVLPPLAS